ncbi:MAG: aldolase/citrate lyase family protein [Caldilineaceae bacterium]
MTELIAPNHTRRKLGDGQTVLGTMVAEIRQPTMMQALANAGFDFAIIDNEHGPFNIESIAELCRAARHVGVTPIVRVPDLLYPFLCQPLDAGAQGLMLPRITSAAQVHQAVQMTKYPPMGARGCALNRGHTDFGPRPLVDFMAAANVETQLIIQIETASAVDQVEDIVAIPGVEVAFIGPNDLSISLGVPGQSDSPVLLGAIERVIAACQRHNVTPAIQVADAAAGAYWKDKGMQMISVNSEMGLLIGAGRSVTSALRDERG